MSSGLSVCPFPGIECRPSPLSIMPDVIRLRAVYRFAARSLRPVEFALASVTSSIVPNVIRAYPPRRPARFGLNAGVAHAAREGLFTFGAASILSISRGCYPPDYSEYSYYSDYLDSFS